jgi:phosphoglucosamine mutase
MYMIMKLFGTDGIRACAGEFPLTRVTINAIGRAIGEKVRGKILIGQDTRVSCPWILENLCRGLSMTPASVQDAGVISTPAVALLTKVFGYSGGVMISASHNPYQDNGIKVFGPDGTKLTDKDEEEIEQRVFQLVGSKPAPETRDTVPLTQITATNETGWPARYQAILLSHFSDTDWLRGLRIVADCANGAMTEIAPRVLTKLGADVTVLNASPNGVNINDQCGAVHIEALQAAMADAGADIGVAFDGDGDRAIFVSSSGRVINGDAVLLLMARRMKRDGLLNPPVVVGTLMTNFSLEQMLRKEGIKLTRVSVGDRFIFEEMQRGAALLGGEPSGHVIFPDFKLSGDGLLTTLKLAEVITSDRASFEDLIRDWEEAPQILRNIPVREKIPLETLPAVQAKMTEVHHELEGCGRLVVRYSGTEPLLRVMIESDDAERNGRLMDELVSVIRKVLV